MTTEKTRHLIYASDSRIMREISDKSVDLVVTSPPYPMIEMWDPMFSNLDPEIGNALEDGSGDTAFRLMHEQLNQVWLQVSRVVRPGGIVCINIGDATRKIGDIFQLFPSHSLISVFFRGTGFHELPSIIWKKPSNSPNKFLGSGTLPVGAYVTLEHEYILLFRREGKRTFVDEGERRIRRESSFFWEERNRWFSDIWEGLTGTRQKMENGAQRARSAAFPFEIPYRLINMYSLVGDTVLDPFAGTGTTAVAAVANRRNSIGYEIDADLAGEARNRILGATEFVNSIIDTRLEGHMVFVKKDEARGVEFLHSNRISGYPVKTSPEENILFKKVRNMYCPAGSEYIEAEYV